MTKQFPPNGLVHRIVGSKKAARPKSWTFWGPLDGPPSTVSHPNARVGPRDVHALALAQQQLRLQSAELQRLRMEVRQLRLGGSEDERD